MEGQAVLREIVENIDRIDVVEPPHGRRTPTFAVLPGYGSRRRHVLTRVVLLPSDTA